MILIVTHNTDSMDDDAEDNAIVNDCITNADAITDNRIVAGTRRNYETTFRYITRTCELLSKIIVFWLTFYEGAELFPESVEGDPAVLKIPMRDEHFKGFLGLYSALFFEIVKINKS